MTGTKRAWAAALGIAALVAFMFARAVPDGILTLELEPVIVTRVPAGDSAALAGGVVTVTSARIITPGSDEAEELYLEDSVQLLVVTVAGQDLTEELCFTVLQGAIDGEPGIWQSSFGFDSNSCLQPGTQQTQVAVTVPLGTLEDAALLTSAGVVWHGFELDV